MATVNAGKQTATTASRVDIGGGKKKGLKGNKSSAPSRRAGRAMSFQLTDNKEKKTCGRLSFSPGCGGMLIYELVYEVEGYFRVRLLCGYWTAKVICYGLCRDKMGWVKY